MGAVSQWEERGFERMSVHFAFHLYRLTGFEEGCGFRPNQIGPAALFLLFDQGLGEGFVQHGSILTAPNESWLAGTRFLSLLGRGSHQGRVESGNRGIFLTRN